MKKYDYLVVGAGLFGAVFASEMKTILAYPGVNAEIDEEGIAQLMLLGPGRKPGSGVFRDIFEIEPGCYGVYENGKLQITRYWQLRDRVHTDSFEETAEQVRYLVLDAIRRQMVADVPVGTFLSGGLDSSLISAVCAREMDAKGQILDTFSLDYANNDKYFRPGKFQPNSDTEYIHIMQTFLDSHHHWTILSVQDLVDLMEDAVLARDLPGMADVDSSLLLFCKEVKKDFTVALSGECADEIFGGYPWYRDKNIRAINGFPWAQSTQYRKNFLKDDIKIPNTDEYVYSRYKDTLINTSKKSNISPLESRMKEMMKLNLDWFMQTLLDRKDRMSMYNGLEVRVPFCDYRIAEYLYSVPWEYKDYNSYEKGLLRKAMEGILPNEILWRKKSPYPKTHNPEYFTLVSKSLKEVIENSSSPLLTFIKKSELEKLLRTDKNEPWYGQLMTTPQTIAYFIQINYWLEKYKIIIK